MPSLQYLVNMSNNLFIFLIKFAVASIIPQRKSMSISLASLWINAWAASERFFFINQGKIIINWLSCQLWGQSLFFVSVTFNSRRCIQETVEVITINEIFYTVLYIFKLSQALENKVHHKIYKYSFSFHQFSMVYFCNFHLPASLNLPTLANMLFISA